jgi:hypothetical protein
LFCSSIWSKIKFYRFWCIKISHFSLDLATTDPASVKPGDNEEYNTTLSLNPDV